MNIKMAGIDHSKAGVEAREAFSFTKSAAEGAMKQVREEFGADGCVILSTCNRTELWLDGGENLDPLDILCRLKGVNPDEAAPYITVRRDEEAVGHLLRTACGMNSRLFGEDQIITQVGDAGDFARELKTSGPVLDNLFRTAVTAAKKVKTQVRLTAERRGAAESTVELLQKEWGGFAGRKILVIGNGNMGKLAAEKLLEAGAQVSMTLRQYKHGGASVPEGCRAVSYEERYAVMEQSDAVVSATASPHYTVHAGSVLVLSRFPQIFVDLAVPRDIDPLVADIPGVKVWDIDSLGVSGAESASEEAAAQAEEILKEYQAEFRRWYDFREAVPLIQQISRKAAEDMDSRMEKCIHTLHLPPEQRDKLWEQIDHHAEKTVAHLLFGLRETLSPELLRDCLKALDMVE